MCCVFERKGEVEPVGLQANWNTTGKRPWGKIWGVGVVSAVVKVGGEENAPVGG